MARLQDFPSVTPTSSDNLLVVQSTGQGLATFGSTFGAKMDKANPTGSGSLSLNRASGSTVGSYSVAEGYNNTASGNYGSHAEGANTQATASASHSEGNSTKSKGSASHAEGYQTEASGDYGSHAEGYLTIANHLGQHVFGVANVADTSSQPSSAKGNYVEIVGNGSSDANRSNARTLDWSGNEVLAGDLSINGNRSIKTELLDKTTSTVTIDTTNIDRTATNNLIKKNGMVQLDLIMYPTALSTLQNKKLATLPSGYLPSSTISCVASLVPNYTQLSKTMALEIQLTSAGEIRCPNNGAYAEIGAVNTNTQITLHCCYFV